MIAAIARTTALAATLFVMASPGAVASEPASTLASGGCLAQGETIYRGMTKYSVNSLVGARGVLVWRGRRAQVRNYVTCLNESVLVRYRKGKVVSAQKKSLLMAADIDGNGTQDYYFDTNGDGYYESAVLDLNGNGYFDQFFVEGTQQSMIFGDQNENGYVEYAGVSPDRSGRLAWIIYDTNEDGVADWYSVDAVGNDGVADTLVQAVSASTYTPPGLTAQQERQANDMMVRHIVTMQQLRQFDVWDYNWYVPNGQTPSLLLPDSSPYRQCGAMCTL